MKVEHHIDCVPKGDNPKGLLRRLFYHTIDSNGSIKNQINIRTPFFLCDGCGMIIMMKQEELIKVNEKAIKKLEREIKYQKEITTLMEQNKEIKNE